MARLTGSISMRPDVSCEQIAVVKLSDGAGCVPSKLTTDELTVRQRQPAKAARTQFKCLGRCNSPAVGLVLASLQEGGRTHQIRRHLQLAGTPIVGDKFYATKKLNRHFRGVHGLLRQFLHAVLISFRHPISKKWVRVISPLPEDLCSFLGRLPHASQWDTTAQTDPASCPVDVWELPVHYLSRHGSDRADFAE